MNDNVLEYKDYWTVIHYSKEDKCLYGQIEGIDDLISFGGDVNDIEDNFHFAVDDYLEDCKLLNKEPNKAYKGTFNIRMPSELHRAIAIESSRRGYSLNQFMSIAATHELAHAYDQLPPKA